jgi:hypothetical protein
MARLSHSKGEGKQTIAVRRLVKGKRREQMRKIQLLSMAVLGSMAIAAPAFAQDDYNNNSNQNPPAPVIMNSNTSNPPATVVVPQPAPQAQQPAVVVNPQPVNRDDATTRAYPGLIWGGATMFGVSYGAAAIGGAVANDVCNAGESWACVKNRNDLYIPVVGPFMAMNDVTGTGSSTAKALLALDGAFQIAGIAMSVTGIIMSAVPTQTRSTNTTVPVAKKKQLMITPYATGTGTGIGAMGTW